MADQLSDEGVSTSNIAPESPESTVEINIKTLDSQLYSFHVDKNMPVSVFKEKIASEIGLPVGQQRLIFRGKVLKDDHLLSEYHVESGHTLHLVARQPSDAQPSSGSNSGETTTNSSNAGQEANATGSRPRVGHISHSVVLGTFGGGEQIDGGAPDISRVIGAVLNSFGIGGQATVGGIGGAQPNMQFTIPVQVAQGNEAGVNVSNQGQTGNQSQPRSPSQSMPQGVQIPVGAAMAIPTLATPIPDSLNTLSEFMNRMEQALSQNGYQPNQPSNNTEGLPAVELPLNARGFPTPGALATVLRQAQRLLSGPVIDSLSHTAGRLEEEEGSTDLTVRTQIQTEAMQSGLAMQHLGALLLELGRTLLTLRIGQTPAESSVNAGPAVYISPSGPNPIMVQPFPLQTNSLFGGHGAPPLSSGVFGPVGVAAVPRHVNIHIHAGIGSRAANGESSQGERANGSAGANSQTRGGGDNTRSENQTPAGQPDGGVPKTEGHSDTGRVGHATSDSTVVKHANDTEGASLSSRGADNPGNASAVPLGLGLAGLQPKRRSRQTRSEASSSTASTSNARSTANQSLTSAGGQLDPATIMNQVMQNPALDGLLAGVSNQTGIGSPDVLRNMLGQLTQNPAMMNAVNQIAQQIDSNQDLGSIFSSMGGTQGSGSSSGLDLSSMVQQMMPFVSQALAGAGGGSGGASSSNVLQQTSSMERDLQHRLSERRTSGSYRSSSSYRSSDSQMDLQNVVQKIEDEDPPQEVFSAVVETAARLNENGSDASGLAELCSEEDLVHEFMEMMKRDVSRRLEEER